jgi:hypothetical protein
MATCLGDLVRRRGALLVHLGLVVALDQDFGLGLQPVQLHAGGGQLALRGAERRLVLPHLISAALIWAWLGSLGWPSSRDLAWAAAG